MDDILPILAFGHPDFQRPVLLFDHADHLFWVGVSIADLVVNLRSYTSELALKRRGVSRSVVLPLPIEVPLFSTSPSEKSRLKESLGFHPEAKIILTLSSPYKFEPFEGYNYVETALKILERTSNTHFLLIGPSLNEPNKRWTEYWKQGVERSNNRIKPIGYINNQDIDRYIQIADLCIDSFPFGSSTSVLDIGKHNIPCLVRRTPGNQLDTFESAGIYCDTEHDLIERAIGLLSESRPETPTPLYTILENTHFPNAFRYHLRQVYAQCPNTHQIYSFKEDSESTLSDFERFNLKMLYYSSIRGGSSQPGLLLLFRKKVTEIVHYLNSLLGKETHEDT
jgi:hypothetical protein